VIQWGVAHAALAGEPKCGDSHLVKLFPGGALIAVLDGIGHGAEACRAAETAGGILESYAQENIVTLLKRCHEILRGSRGVVMSVASFDFRERTMAWLGVGNVEGLLLRPAPAQPARETLLLRAGVLGHQLPTLQASHVRLCTGDTLIFTTDGIRNGFTLGAEDKNSPQQIADHILHEDSKGTDDSLVLVARYIGSDTAHA
jgi:phosphoserine phosphatase RsbX